MKKIVLLIIFIPLLSIAQSGDLKYYGEKISSQNTVTLKGLINHAKDKSLAKVNGTILSSCPKKGCWMQVQVETDTIQVTFKDYGFFVPLAAKGKTVVIDGQAAIKTVSVKELKHFAEDAKKSQAEIDAITQPKTEVNILAKGIVVVG